MGITISRLGRRRHVTPIGPLALLIGLIGGPAQAQDVLVRQPPDAQHNVALAAPSAGTAAGESVVALPNGALLRVAKASSKATPAPIAAVPPGDSTHWASPTQALRIAPGRPASEAIGGAAPSSAAARVAPVGANLQVRKVGSVQMLELRGQAPALLPAPAASAADLAVAAPPLPVGIKVVDLPPGALMPEGPPAALTLYRSSRKSAAVITP